MAKAVKAIAGATVTCIPSAAPLIREATPPTPMILTRQMETQIWQEHRPHEVQLPLHMPRDKSLELAGAFSLTWIPTYPLLTSPYKSENEKNAHSSHPIPRHIW